MTLNGWLQILLFLLAIFLVTRPLGSYMAAVFARRRTWLDPMVRPVERLVYRLTRVDETHDMRWTEYAVSLLLFSVVSMLALYVLQRAQGFLPFNPQGFGGVAACGVGPRVGRIVAVAGPDVGRTCVARGDFTCAARTRS